MPSCDQTGVPLHFHSSTTSESASLMSLRIRLRVSPRQSPSSAILFEMSSDADSPWFAPDFFMFAFPGGGGGGMGRNRVALANQKVSSAPARRCDDRRIQHHRRILDASLSWN